MQLEIAATTICYGAQHGLGQRQPLRSRMRAKAGRHFPHFVSPFLHRRKARVCTNVAADALQRSPLHHGAYVVQYQFAQTCCRLRCHSNANQAAHAGAHPVNRLCAASA